MTDSDGAIRSEETGRKTLKSKVDEKNVNFLKKIAKTRSHVFASCQEENL